MEVEYLPQLIAQAEEFALENDRMKLRPYFLYCPNTFEVAKKLAEELFEVKSNHVDNSTITLQTNIKHREFTIMIEARILFKIFVLDRYREVSLTEVMEPVVATGWFGSSVKVFPYTMVLIDLYQTLYSPSKCKLWEDSFTRVNIIQQNTQQYNGGFDKNIAKDILIRGLLKDPRIVLVGDHATAKLGIGQGTRLQILTDIPIEELSDMTSRKLSAEKNQLRRVKVTHERVVHVKYNLNMPSDFQIVKYTIYAMVNGDQVALFDAFNSPTYEMIPVVKIDGVQIGSPFVLMRFIYIDIWAIKLIIGIGKYKNKSGGCDIMFDGGVDNGLQLRINMLSVIARSLHEYINAGINDPFKIFARDYVGVNTSDVVAKKKIIANIGYRLPNYYPVLNIKDTE